VRVWAVVLLLLVAVVATSVGLVALKHQSRQLFIELEHQAELRDAHQARWSRLQIELAWRGEAGRIEQRAVEQLRMIAPVRTGVLVARDD
jgi:cell division protein FtsL